MIAIPVLCTALLGCSRPAPDYQATNLPSTTGSFVHGEHGMVPDPRGKYDPKVYGTLSPVTVPGGAEGQAQIWADCVKTKTKKADTGQDIEILAWAIQAACREYWLMDSNRDRQIIADYIADQRADHAPIVSAPKPLPRADSRF